MSSEIVIRAQGLCKRYHIYDQPIDRLKQLLVPRVKRALRLDAAPYYKEFWALRGVSFEIRAGESFGIVGMNGSGKSTLLQIICGTLNPSDGRVDTFGRIAALLELGAGFNPEFTGRENIYLNAALLGLSKREIEEKFEDIASFADIGEFIEQPVKTYSSGMYVRLAFAVIAHVDADILIIDEALAVGDAVFTQKCMRFLRRFKETGTLVFVSHDMNSVLNLCERAMWLDHGIMTELGDSKDVAESYLQHTLQSVYGDEAKLEKIESQSKVAASDAKAVEQSVDYSATFRPADNLTNANGWKTGAGEIASVRLYGANGAGGETFEGGEMVTLSIEAKIYQEFTSPILGFLVRDRLGQDLFGENTLPFTKLRPTAASANSVLRGEFFFRLPMLPNGEYAVMVSLADGELHDHIQHHWLHDALILSVSSSKVRFGLVGIPFSQVSLSSHL